MREMTNRLHRQYGFGLADLRASVLGAVSPDGDPTNNQPKKNADGTVTYNGININPADEKSFVLGAISGLQYNNNTFGKCFYAAADTLNFLDYMQ
jgi:hypothetical protein